jgi:AbrB family looped-hinge helix DNA binding protein
MDHTERYAIALGDRGRLVLPSQLRQRLNLQTGDRLIVTVDDEGASGSYPRVSSPGVCVAFIAILPPGAPSSMS